MPLVRAGESTRRNMLQHRRSTRPTDFEDTDIVFDVQDIRTCPGPCRCNDPEPEPIDVDGERIHIFKPYSGGRYAAFYYPMLDARYVVIRNVRICAKCFHRYQDMHDALEDERQPASGTSHSDAEAIIEKLVLLESGPSEQRAL
jgi:hypothetical protein